MIELMHQSNQDPVYTIATLVTDFSQYAEMQTTFAAAGFSGREAEYLHVDNTRTLQTSAYEGLNQLLNRARGRYVILCHQDVRLHFDCRKQLEKCLADLDVRDPAWALAGNAGGESAGRLAIRITDPHGSNRRIGTLPARVASLDENFIIVKRESRIGFSRNLKGFHLYGADICMVADLLGYSAYVIDFHLEHLSPGRKTVDFHVCAEQFTNKWSHALRPRWLQTTCTLIPLNGHPFADHLSKTVARVVEILSRRLPRTAGWTLTRPNRS